jgi:phage head maturation protease
MKLTTPMQITAADSDARTITGRIVAFNEHANASTGKVVFARGSIQPNDVFLNLEHDNTRRIGRSVAMSVNDKEMTATFQNRQHNSGFRCIGGGNEGLRDGFSIELAVDNFEMQKDGTMKVLNGQLTAVALVTEPAVRSARVSEVAASEILKLKQLQRQQTQMKETKWTTLPNQ